MTKQLRSDFKAISMNLKALTQRTEKMVKALDKLEKGRLKTGKRIKTVKKKAARKRVATKKAKGRSATEMVLKIIGRSRKGVDTAKLQMKTGYNTRKIWDIVHRAYKEGKIKKAGRGTYVKA